MSVLSVPRIYFKGSMFWDPDTANNDASYYDEKTNDIVLPENNPPTNVDGDIVTDENYKQYMMEYIDWDIKDDQGNVVETTKNIRGNNWGYYGNHSCGFVDDQYRNHMAQKWGAQFPSYIQNVAITGGTDINGNYISEDSLINKGIQIFGNKFNDRRTAARLVDSNPHGSQSSQIFFADLEIGDDEAGICGSRHRRMYSYWVGVQRSLNACLNYAVNFSLASPFGAVWQTAIPYDQLKVNLGDSQLIAQLDEAMKQDGALGLMIRFIAQSTAYYVHINGESPNSIVANACTLSNLYLENLDRVIINPAYSYGVGSIGVWKQEELATAPGGFYLSVKDPAPLQEGIETAALGPLLAELDESSQTLSLDTISTFPYQNNSGTVTDVDDFNSRCGTVVDYGDVANFGDVVLKAGNTTIATLNYSQYNKTAYEECGGILDIRDLTPDQIAAIQSNSLTLEVPQAGSDAVVALQEENFTALSEDRSIYIEEGDAETCTVRVRDKRGGIPEGTRLFVAQYIFEGAQWVYVAPNNPDRRVDISGTVVDSGWVIDLSEGVANLTLTTVTPGCSLISFLPLSEGQDPPLLPPSPENSPNKANNPSDQKKGLGECVKFVIQKLLQSLGLNVSPSTVSPDLQSGEPLDLDLSEWGGNPYSYFSVIRVMPFDNPLGEESQTPNENLTWVFMYEKVFRVYDLIYPIMSDIIPMNNRKLMEGAWMQIKAVLGNPDMPHEDDPMWQSTMYMSITRDLSKGKRKLLDRWCNLVSRGNQPD